MPTWAPAGDTMKSGTGVLVEGMGFIDGKAKANVVKSVDEVQILE